MPHWDAVLRILKYLKGSPGRGLLYKDHGHLCIEGYADADWASSPLGRRFTTGYCTFVGGNLVTWKSKKTKQQLRDPVLKQNIELCPIRFVNLYG